MSKKWIFELNSLAPKGLNLDIEFFAFNSWADPYWQYSTLIWIIFSFCRLRYLMLWTVCTFIDICIYGQHSSQSERTSWFQSSSRQWVNTAVSGSPWHLFCSYTECSSSSEHNHYDQEEKVKVLLSKVGGFLLLLPQRHRKDGTNNPASPTGSLIVLVLATHTGGSTHRGPAQTTLSPPGWTPL